MEHTGTKGIPSKHGHIRHGTDSSMSELISGCQLIQKLLWIIIPLTCSRRRHSRLRPRSGHQQRRYPNKSRRRHLHSSTLHDHSRYLRFIHSILVQTTHNRTPPTLPRQPLRGTSLQSHISEYLHVRWSEHFGRESTAAIR